MASGPGSGKTPAAYEADRRGCMGEVDRRLQSVSDRANTIATPLAAVAANNRQLQIAYDRGFTDCMVARGEAVASPALPAVAVVQQVATAPPATPVAATGAPAELPGGWRLMQLSFHAATGKPRDENDVLWAREMVGPTAGPGQSLPMYALRFNDGPRSILLSIAGQGEPTCDDGPSGALVTRDYAVCPGKLALVEAGRVIAVRAAGMLCAEAINTDGNAPGSPGWQDPARWGTRGRYDAASGTIDLVTMQNGRPEPACAKRLHVR